MAITYDEAKGGYTDGATTWSPNSDGVYEIGNLDQLKFFRDAVNDGNSFNGQTVKLTTSIDLNNEEWTPIGKNGATFQGTFDGQGNTVSNLKITREISNFAENCGIGFFGYTNAPATITNLTINNVDITGSLYIGAVVGYGFTGKEISNCHVTGDVEIEGWWYIGGIGGNGYVSKVSDCSVVGNEGSYIKAVSYDNEVGSYVGGIWGYRGEGNNTIADCSVDNIDISGMDRIGGICGIAHYANTIEECSISNSSITADNNIGNVGLIAGANLGNATDGPAILLNNTADVTTKENFTLEGQVIENPPVLGANINTGAPAQAAIIGDVTRNEAGEIVDGTISVVGTEKDSIDVSSKLDLADGLAFYPNSDGTISVDEAGYVAAIGDTRYTSFENAQTAVKPGETITILTDVDAENISMNGYGLASWNNSKLTATGNIIATTGDNVLSGNVASAQLKLEGSKAEKRTLTITESANVDLYTNGALDGGLLDIGKGLSDEVTTADSGKRVYFAHAQIAGDVSVERYDDKGNASSGAIYIRPYSELVVTGNLDVVGEVHNRGSLVVDGGTMSMSVWATPKLLGYTTGDSMTVTNKGTMTVSGASAVTFGEASASQQHMNVDAQYADGMFATISAGGQFVADTLAFANDDDVTLTVTGEGSTFELYTDGRTVTGGYTYVQNEGKIIIEDKAVFDVSGLVNTNFVNTGTIDISSATATFAVLTNYGTLNVNGGTVTADTNGSNGLIVGDAWDSASGILNVTNGGTLTASYSIQLNSTSVVKIDGGSMSALQMYQSEGGELSIVNGGSVTLTNSYFAMGGRITVGDVDSGKTSSLTTVAGDEKRPASLGGDYTGHEGKTVLNIEKNGEVVLGTGLLVGHRASIQDNVSKDATVNVNEGGKLQVAASLQIGSVGDDEAVGVVNVNGGTLDASAATVGLNSKSSLNINGGSFTAQSITNNGAINVTGEALVAAEVAATETGSFTITDATLGEGSRIQFGAMNEEKLLPAVTLKGTVTVTDGAYLNAGREGNLTMGFGTGDSGTLNISNGAQVSLGGALYFGSEEALTDDGMFYLNISGEGSRLQSDGYNGEFYITGDAVVSVSNGGTIANNARVRSGATYIFGAADDTVAANVNFSKMELVEQANVTIQGGAVADLGILVFGDQYMAYDGSFTLAADSLLKIDSYSAFSGEAEITVSGMDDTFSGVWKLIDNTGSNTLDYSAMISNWNDISGSVAVVENDLYRVNVDMTTLKVNSTWSGSEIGTEVEEGFYYGFNAFDGINTAVVGIADDTTTISIAAGDYAGSADAEFTQGVAIDSNGAKFDNMWSFGVNSDTAAEFNPETAEKFTVSGELTVGQFYAEKNANVYVVIDGDLTTVGSFGAKLATQLDLDGSVTVTPPENGAAQVMVYGTMNITGTLDSTSGPMAAVMLIGNDRYDTEYGKGGVLNVTGENASVTLCGNTDSDMPVLISGLSSLNLSDGATFTHENGSIENKGTINVASSTLTVGGALKNSGSIYITGTSTINGAIAGGKTYFGSKENSVDATWNMAGQNNGSYVLVNGKLTVAASNSENSNEVITIGGGAWPTYAQAELGAASGTLLVNEGVTLTFNQLRIGDRDDNGNTHEMIVNGAASGGGVYTRYMGALTVNAGASLTASALLSLGGTMTVDGGTVTAKDKINLGAKSESGTTDDWSNRVATLTLKNGAEMSVAGNLLAGFQDDVVRKAAIELDNSTLTIAGNLVVGEASTSTTTPKSGQATVDVRNHSTLTVSDLYLTADNSVTMDYTSMLAFSGRIDNAGGTITIDMTNYDDRGYKLIDHTGSDTYEAEDYKLLLGEANWNENYAVFENDLYLITTDTARIGVDDDWAGKTDGDIVAYGEEYFRFGTNAFANLTDAVGAAAEEATILVADGTYDESVVVSGNRNLEIGDIKLTSLTLGTKDEAFTGSFSMGSLAQVSGGVSTTNGSLVLVNGQFTITDYTTAILCLGSSDLVNVTDDEAVQTTYTLSTGSVTVTEHFYVGCADPDVTNRHGYYTMTVEGDGALTVKKTLNVRQDGVFNVKGADTTADLSQFHTSGVSNITDGAEVTALNMYVYNDDHQAQVNVTDSTITMSRDFGGTINIGYDKFRNGTMSLENSTLDANNIVLGSFPRAAETNPNPDTKSYLNAADSSTVKVAGTFEIKDTGVLNLTDSTLTATNTITNNGTINVAGTSTVAAEIDGALDLLNGADVTFAGGAGDLLVASGAKVTLRGELSGNEVVYEKGYKYNDDDARGITVNIASGEGTTFQSYAWYASNGSIYNVQTGSTAEITYANINATGTINVAEGATLTVVKESSNILGTLNVDGTLNSVMTVYAGYTGGAYADGAQAGLVNITGTANSSIVTIGTAVRDDDKYNAAAAEGANTTASIVVNGGTFNVTGQEGELTSKLFVGSTEYAGTLSAVNGTINVGARSAAGTGYMRFLIGKKGTLNLDNSTMTVYNLGGTNNSVEGVFQNSGTINMDLDSQIVTATVLANSGTITVDMTDAIESGVYKLIDYTGTGTVTDYGTVTLTNNDTYGYTTTILNNDLYLVQAGATEYYVNSAWSNSSLSDEVTFVDGTKAYYGLNAFDTVDHALTATSYENGIWLNVTGDIGAITVVGKDVTEVNASAKDQIDPETGTVAADAIVVNLVDINNTNAGWQVYYPLASGSNAQIYGDITTNFLSSTFTEGSQTADPNFAGAGYAGTTATVYGDTMVNIGADGAANDALFLNTGFLLGAGGGTVNGDSSLNIYSGTIEAGAVVGGGAWGGLVKGDSSVTISGGEITLGTSTYNAVYGGSYGYANPTSAETRGSASVTIKGDAVVNGKVIGGSDQTAVTGTTVEISGEAQVNGNVYAGGNRGGQVTGNTSVKVNGGTVNGNVFGGGYASDVTGTTSLVMTGGTVNGALLGGGEEGNVGDTSIEVSGGTIYSGVAGGGASGTAGNTKVHITGDTQITGGGYGVVLGGGQYIGADVESTSVVIEGNVRITDTWAVEDEGTGLNYGYVYGGGWSGSVNGDTNVVVKGNALVASGVLGGGSWSDSDPYEGSVKGNTYVEIAENAVIGDTHEGYVYGGGWGQNVEGSATVVIKDNATIKHSVVGGGIDSTVASTDVRIEGGTVGKNIYAGGYYNDSTLPVENSDVLGDASVTISGGTVSGNVYAGGFYSNVNGNASVTLSGGTVGGDIYGGSESSGTVAGSSTLNVGATDAARYTTTLNNVYDFDVANITNAAVTVEGVFSATQISIADSTLTLNSGFDAATTTVSIEVGAYNAENAALVLGSAVGTAPAISISAGSNALTEARYLVATGFDDTTAFSLDESLAGEYILRAVDGNIYLYNADAPYFTTELSVTQAEGASVDGYYSFTANFEAAGLLTGYTLKLYDSATATTPVDEVTLDADVIGQEFTLENTTQSFWISVTANGENGLSTDSPTSGRLEVVVKDYDSPVIQSVSSNVASDAITLTSEATDNFGVTGYEFILDGQSLGVQTGSEIALDLSTLTAGTHSYTVNVYDAAGNLATSAEQSFDFTPGPGPEPGPTEPANFLYSSQVRMDNGETVSVYATYSDAAAALEYRIGDSGEWLTYDATTGVNVSSSTTVYFREQGITDPVETAVDVTVVPADVELNAEVILLAPTTDTTYEVIYNFADGGSKAVELSGNSVEHYALPENTTVTIVEKDASGEVVNTIVEETPAASTTAEIPDKVVAVDDGHDNLFFATPVGQWGTGIAAQHLGDGTWGGTLEIVSLTGKNRFSTVFTGSDDATTLFLTDDANGDVFFLDDIYTANGSDARIRKMSEIQAGAGDDIVDLTSARFAYEEHASKQLTVRGGDGNDILWGNAGHNIMFGDDGNDRIYGGSDNDVLIGGTGNDTMLGGGGDDIFCYGSSFDWGSDTITQLSGGTVTLYLDGIDRNDCSISGSTLTWNDGTHTGSITLNGVSWDSVKFYCAANGDGDLTKQSDYEELKNKGAFAAISSH